MAHLRFILNLVEMPSQPRICDEVEGEAARVQDQAVLQREASSLCSLASSLMPRLIGASNSLSEPRSSLRVLRGTRKSPCSDSTNSTLEPSSIPYFSRILTGIVTMLLLVTVATCPKPCHHT